VTECARAIFSQIQTITHTFSNVGRFCPTLQSRNYETQRKTEYEVFTAKYRRGKLWRSKSGLKNQKRFFTAAKSKPFREGQNIGDCSITTDKIIHPENNKN